MAKEKVISSYAKPQFVGRLRPGGIQLTVERSVKAEQVHAALDKIFDMHGCAPCGLNGLDIYLRHSTPLMDAFKGFEGIAAVEQFGV